MSLRSSGLALFACLASVPSLWAQDPESDFQRAYFLERERGELAEARTLYEKVAASAAAAPVLQGRARDRAAAIEEDLASQDFARLMPPGSILFAELARPAEALLDVLGELGLIGSLQEAAAARGFAVRPELVRALAGIRGLAIALTRLPAGGGLPGGVAVLHAGELDVLRALIEASVLAAGAPADPIEGVPAWTIESRVHVALTRRLVIAATERDEIAGVLRRLAHGDAPSLASRSALQAELAQRGNSPFFCALDATPLRPLLAAELAARSARDPGAKLLAAALDVDGLRGCVARVATRDGGLVIEADLLLGKEHRNLVFNLLRNAPIDPVLLERIPEGVAAFACGSFNERGPALAPLYEGAGGTPVVTALDFGRELFANLAGWALFVVPGGAPVPAAALALSSNDPARTGAVLGLLLGLGDALAGGAALEGEAREIAGAPTRVFQVPPGVRVYLTTHESTLLLSPSAELIEQALDGRSTGNSVLHDEAFARELGRLGKDTTFALYAHAGRSLGVAGPFLADEQRASLAPWAPLLADTVAALRIRHSGTQLGAALAFHGLPRVDGMVTAALRRQRAERGSTPASAPPAHEGLAQRFARLAAHGDGGAAARSFARAQLPALAGDARALNNFAWSLLTEERFAPRFDDVALEYAQAANDASQEGVWQYLDTLALARFRLGAPAEAVALEERALRLVEAAADRADVEAALARYRAAADALASKNAQR
jgi:hypothetical protein